MESIAGLLIKFDFIFSGLLLVAIPIVLIALAMKKPEHH